MSILTSLISFAEKAKRRQHVLTKAFKDTIRAISAVVTSPKTVESNFDTSIVPYHPVNTGQKTRLFKDHERESQRSPSPDISSKSSDPENPSIFEGRILFALRVHQFRIGHVEELNNFVLKRSNAMRRKTENISRADHSRSQLIEDSSRTFSYIIPVQLVSRPSEEVLGPPQIARRGAIRRPRGRLVPSLYEVTCVRQATLANLDGVDRLDSVQDIEPGQGEGLRNELADVAKV